MNNIKSINVNIIIEDNFIFNNHILYKDIIVESYFNNKWKKLEYLEETSYNEIYVSHFGLEPIFNLKYFDNKYPPQKFEVNSDKNKILKVNFYSYKLYILKNNNIKFDTAQIKEYNYNDRNKLGLIGYLNENNNFWYPLFFGYDKYFEYNRNTGNAKEELSKIIKEYGSKYSNSEMNGNYGLLAYEIAKLESNSDDNKIQFLKDFLEGIIDKLKEKTPSKLNNINNKLKK